MKHLIIVATFVLLVFSLVRFSLGEVVYDSLPFTAGGFGINDVGTTGNQVGQTVRLSGELRQISQFEVALGAGGAGGFRIRFYESDGAVGTPGSLIWQSPIQIYPFESPFYNRKVVSVNVPNITVPDMFAWVVLSEVPAGNMLVLSSDPPTVGESFQAWYRRVGQNWVDVRVNGGVYGARINAVPEPSSVLLCLAGIFATLMRRQRTRG